MINDFFTFGIIKRTKDSIKINNHNIRDWALDNYKKVDDKVFGMGPGLLLKPDIIKDALLSIEEGYVIHMSPRGTVFNAKKAQELSTKKHLIIISSRYEGLDQRFIDDYVDEEISIGDYVLSGGELASLVIIDSILRMTGKILRLDAVEDESFQHGLLEYHQYTKPNKFNGVDIPKYLKSGNHKLIQEKRIEEQLYITWKRRKDLFRNYPLCDVEVINKNPLTNIKKQNLLLKKRLEAFEKAIRENKDV